LRAADVPSGPLYTLAEVFEDPQVRHLGMKATTAHATQGTIAMVRSGMSLSATPPTIRAAAPALGEHTAEILGRIGYGP
jgi:crotonobetainyl-CoA:carnitine CoA-transferase CaiB-like acyl-CoA transferase